MPAPAITLEVLPAGYGDCLLVQCPVGKRTWRLLVDTGPDETYPALKARLAALPLDSLGQRYIDLFIVTHIDHDHIGAASLLLNDRTLGLSFGDIWFNAPPRPTPRGVAEGQSLAELLGAMGTTLPWNKAFGGKTVVSTGESGAVELTTPVGQPKITLLSPNASRLADLYRVWDRELARLRSGETDKAERALPLTVPADAIDVKALAAKRTPVDHAVANGSSIAILLEHRGASVVLGADAFASVMVPALHSLAAKRKRSLPMKVDAIKLSHHGSRGNVTNDLLAAIQAEHYLFSTNNAIFNHPDDESVARVLVNGGKQPTLWFNYATMRNLRWASSQAAAEFTYKARYPEAPGQGVQIELTARRIRRPRQ